MIGCPGFLLVADARNLIAKRCGVRLITDLKDGEANLISVASISKLAIIWRLFPADRRCFDQYEMKQIR